MKCIANDVRTCTASYRRSRLIKLLEDFRKHAENFWKAEIQPVIPSLFGLALLLAITFVIGGSSAAYEVFLSVAFILGAGFLVLLGYGVCSRISKKHPNAANIVWYYFLLVGLAVLFLLVYYLGGDRSGCPAGAYGDLMCT